MADQGQAQNGGGGLGSSGAARPEGPTAGGAPRTGGGGAGSRSRSRNRNRNRNRGGAGGNGRNDQVPSAGAAANPAPSASGRQPKGRGAGANAAREGARHRQNTPRPRAPGPAVERPNGPAGGRGRPSAPGATVSRGSSPVQSHVHSGHAAQASAVALERTVRANTRRALVVAALGAGLPALVLGVVLGLTVGPIVGIAVFVVVAVLGTAAILRRSVAIALGLLGAVPCDPGLHARLYNVTEGLCATFGLRVPELWVVDDPVPNACALGHRRDDAVLVFTSGVLRRLDLIELEGLVAHELAHVKRHETAIAAVAVVVLWPLARLTGRDSWLHALLGEGREYEADQLAAATICYPVGLHDALITVAGGPAPVATSVFAPGRLAVTRWIWADPYPGAPPDDRAKLGGTLDAVGVRAAALTQW